MYFLVRPFISGVYARGGVRYPTQGEMCNLSWTRYLEKENSKIHQMNNTLRAHNILKKKFSQQISTNLLLYRQIINSVNI